MTHPEGRVALVTGASRMRGIGVAVCRELARAGNDVAFTHWRAYDAEMPWGADTESPESFAAELRALGVRALPVAADLSDVTTPAALLDNVEQELGSVTVLVNNAAYSTSDGLEGLTADVLDAHYHVNMRGTMLLSAEFARRFRAGRGGRIINLTSGQSRGPMPGELAYGATKGAIEAFTLSFSAVVAQRGITVNAVNPGPTETGWMDEELRAMLRTKFPAGRIGQPEDAARLIAFLASDAAEWITGQVIHSEGGFERG
jgi:3-oxoacyl-[acyl-carrier protein] reductase